MGFRFRRSARLGPLRFNFSSGGLPSISVGGRGACFISPGNHRGGPPHLRGAAGYRPELNRAAHCGSPCRDSGWGWLRLGLVALRGWPGPGCSTGVAAPPPARPGRPPGRLSRCLILLPRALGPSPWSCRPGCTSSADALASVAAGYAMVHTWAAVGCPTSCASTLQPRC